MAAALGHSQWHAGRWAFRPAFLQHAPLPRGVQVCLLVDAPFTLLQRLIDYYGIKLDGKRLVLMIEDPKVGHAALCCDALCHTNHAALHARHMCLLHRTLI